MLWTDCLTRLRQELSDNVFAMWIRPLVAEEVDGVMRLYAPNPYWTRYIQDNHLELISILAEQLSEGRIRQVEILVDSRPGTILSSSEQPATTTAALNTQTTPTRIKKEPDLVQPSQKHSEITKEKTAQPAIHFFTVCGRPFQPDGCGNLPQGFDPAWCVSAQSFIFIWSNRFG